MSTLRVASFEQRHAIPAYNRWEMCVSISFKVSSSIEVLRWLPARGLSVRDTSHTPLLHRRRNGQADLGARGGIDGRRGTFSPDFLMQPVEASSRARRDGSRGVAFRDLLQPGFAVMLLRRR